MEEQGLSKADLARAARIPYHRLNPWFIRDNAKPNAEDIETVAAALKVQPSFLISGHADGPVDERSWIISVYDNLPPDKQAQLEGFARFLADEAKDSQGTGRTRKVAPAKSDRGT